MYFSPFRALVVNHLLAFSFAFQLQNPLGIEPGSHQDQYLIELNPGEARWVTEEEKWSLKRVSISASSHNHSS